MLNYIVIATGGALGALLRAVIADFFPYTHGAYSFFLPTLVVNLIGSVLIGCGWFYFVEYSGLSLMWRNLLMTGFFRCVNHFLDLLTG